MTIRSITWVSEEPIHPRAGGGGVRQSGLVEALARRVSLDVVTVEDPVPAVVAAARSITRIPASDVPGRARRVLDVAKNPRAYPEVATASRIRTQMLRELRRMSPGEGAVTVVNHFVLAPLLSEIAGPTILHAFHVPSTQLHQEAALASRRRRSRLHFYGRRAQALERWAGAAAHLTITVCAADHDLLKTPETRRIVAPNGVDLGSWELPAAPRSPVVLFPGSFGYLPNVDGARWFVEQVWPRVRAAVPEATLVLAGRSPTADVRAMASADIRVLPDVPDMRALFAESRAVVVPLRIGTGTRLKILEGMAARRAVVSTTVGASGLPVTAGRELRIEDDATGFADAVIEAVGSDRAEEVEERITRGRSLVEREFGWDRIADQLLAQLDSVFAS